MLHFRSSHPGLIPPAGRNVAHRRQRKREAAPWQRKADEKEEEEWAVAIKILKRVVLSFRCAKNNKTLFRIQFNCPVSHFVAVAKQYYGPVRHSGAETHLTNNSGDKCETA